MSGTLNHPPSDVVRQLLIDLGFGTSSGTWPVYSGLHPDSPDDSICVYDTEGRTQGRAQTDGETCEKFGIQVAVRSGSPTTGEAKARSISMGLDVDVLRDLVTVGASTYLIQSMTRVGGVVPLGQETGSRRRRWTLNLVASVRLVS